MYLSIATGILRTLLAAGSGAAVAKGLVDANTAQAAIGALLTLFTTGWSVASKVKAAKK